MVVALPAAPYGEEHTPDAVHVYAAEHLAALQACLADPRLGPHEAGGIGPAKRIAEFAESARLKCTVGSNLELGVGSAAMVHLAMATRGIAAEEFPCDIIGPLFYTGEILTRPLALCGGKALALDGPGLGVELDEEQVNRYRVT